MSDDMWIRDMTTKLTGVIFRKALIEDDWSKVYENVVKEIFINQFEDEMGVLKILGNFGG
ncbi:MAG: hypothetical protein J4428_01225 [Candidatus Aenigmarchaeota archaeon]|nr:hypothetical protein [Candidatus Aenigmarchaeota archaeon]